ncbi:MAG: extracellular matrix/biofilm biosynthesis regulator RemA family protein [Acutalibacteraceae bacterium]
MRNKFFDIGAGAYVNSDEVEFILDTNAGKVRRFFKKYGIDRNTNQVFDATSTDEIKSMIFLKSGKIALSNMRATLLVKRANKDFSSEKEKGVEIPKTKNSKEESPATPNDFSHIRQSLNNTVR